ncbi:MAG: hypothetical protein JW940_13990 [Polyangiaceae bacterium]|nr:hypothetical protein [Polyangiaceae bacterium]
MEQPAKPVTKAPAKGRAKKLSAEEARAQLLDQFEALKTATQEVVEQVSLRLTAQLTEASRRLTLNGGLDAPPRPVSLKTSRTMLAVLRKLRLKPKKGRLKDLARIERAVDELLALTEPA